MAEYYQSGNLSTLIQSSLSLTTNTSSININYDVSLPLSNYCENCDITKQTYPTGAEIENGSILYNLLTNTQAQQFTILINNSQTYNGESKMQYDVLESLFTIMLKHYNASIESVDSLFDVHYVNELSDAHDDSQFYQYDFYLGLTPTRYQKLASLCDYLPAASALLSKQNFNTNGTTTIDITDTATLTTLAASYDFRVLEGSVHQEVLTQLFSKADVSSNKLSRSLTIEQLITQVKDNEIIFGDLWTLLSIRASIGTTYVTQVDQTIRQSYFMRYNRIYTRLEQYVSSSVLSNTMNLEERDYSISSTSKFIKYIGNQQLISNINKAIKRGLVGNYDSSSFPFLYNINLNYASASQSAFGIIPDAPIPRGELTSREEIQKGGELEHVLLTGELIVVTNADGIEKRDYQYQTTISLTNSSTYEEWNIELAAMVLSQYYGRYIQVIFQRYSGYTSAQVVQQLGSKLDYSSKHALRTGSRGDSVVPHANIAIISMGLSLGNTSFLLGNPFTSWGLGILSKQSTYTLYQVLSQICSSQIKCVPEDCELINQLIKSYSTSISCSATVSASTDVESDALADNNIIGIQETLLPIQQLHPIDLHVSSLPIAGGRAVAARPDARAPDSVTDSSGRAMGAVSIAASLTLMLISTVVLVLFGAGKIKKE